MENEQMTEKELKYWKIMQPNSGVLYLMGKPGFAKTACIESIAKKLNYQYFDLRLSQMDETDIGLYPNLVDGIVKHSVPEWAALSNEAPSIIVFEELNRARDAVRNAALQILLERRIGYKFKFNPNVYMCATGNLGEEDGTTVEEFDTALWNRLISVKHDLTIKEWEDGFAKNNVYELILKFINSHPDHFYKMPSENFKAYATPRSWTFLSNRLKYEASDSIQDAIEICKADGHSYIGNSIIPFIRYLEDQSLLNIRNVIEEYSKYKQQIETLSRSKKSELLVELKSIKLEKIKNQSHVNNIVTFLNNIHEDERVSYLIHLIDNEIDESSEPNKNVKFICNSFKEDLQYITNSNTVK